MQRAEPARLRFTLSVAAHAEARSKVFGIHRGETVSVEHKAAPHLEIYIHNSDKVLLAKDSEGRAEVFEWQAPDNMQAYVFVRNISDPAGTVNIEVSQPSALGENRAVLPDAAVIKVYFAADRKLTGDADDPFGTDPSVGALQYGVCNVSIPRNHKMGELEGPVIWKLEFRPDRDKHIFVVGRPVIAPEGAFFNTLKNEFAQSKERQALVFVHGFNTEFLEAVRRTAQLNYDLGLGTIPVLYSWASKGSISPFAYTHDVRNADLSSTRFQQFLLDLAQRGNVQTIHVIAHSMGNRVLSQALAKIGANSPAHIRQVALMAPDIDADLFRQLAGQMRAAAEKITLYASSRDAALIVSEWWASYPRAGEGGEKIVVAPGIDTIDATNVDSNFLGLFHGYYADSRTVIGDMYELFHGKQPLSRFGLFETSRNGVTYWAFKQ